MENRKNIISSSTSKTLSKLQQATDTSQEYPKRENRYWQLGWNGNAQDCFTEKDTRLLKVIQDEHLKLFPPNEKPHFATTKKKAWGDYWECDLPTLDGKPISYADKSFTLPNREAKDAKMFPLWAFADDHAKQIANWQAERAGNSAAELINDPTMLVFEELREWFFHTLAERPGKPEDLQYITQRQSYINNLVYKLPDFGKDRLHLLDLSKSLNNAYNIVLSAMANRELPQLLSGTIIDAKSLENTIGTYLHHLLINQKVEDNFSLGCVESSDNSVCTNSPVKKVYNAAKEIAGVPQQNELLSRYQEKNSLYVLNPVNENNQHVKPQLRTDAANAVQFASFVTQDDKKNYIEALAMLETLTNVRKTLESFQSLQAKIGTYSFAYRYLDEAKELASNYNALVVKTTGLLGDLINSAENGLRNILSNNANGLKKQNVQFEKNLRALQTKVVIDTTLENQLDVFSKKAIGSMNIYSGKMTELVADLKSGKASDEVMREMQALYIQLSDLNIWITAMLNNEQLTIDINQNEQCMDMQKELFLTNEKHSDVSEKIEQIQPVRIPDRLDAIIATATRSAGYGVMRGATNVLGNALQSHGYSQQIATISSQVAYYSMYFASRFYSNYHLMQNQEPNTRTFDAMQYAALETGQMWVTSTVCNQAAQYLESIGDALQRNNWICTGAGLKKLGSLAHYGLFAVTATTSDPIQATIGFAAGSAAEAVTERVGNLFL